MHIDCFGYVIPNYLQMFLENHLEERLAPQLEMFVGV